MKPGHYIQGGQRFTDDDEAACELTPEGKPMEGWVIGLVMFFCAVLAVCGAVYRMMQFLFG